MTVIVNDGRLRVTFANNVANVASPTLAEVNGGTSLEKFIPPDGLDIAAPTGNVEISNIASKQDSEAAGRVKPAISIKFHHNAPTDTAWNLLPYRTSGFLIVRRGVDATQAWASADKVGVYPIQTGEPTDEKMAKETAWDFNVPIFVTDDINQRAVIA